MPDQNDDPLAFEPINEPIIISKVNNENEQNTLSEMLNRQKKSYDDIQSIKYQLADTGNKSNIFQIIREQRDLSKKINTNISNLTTSIPNAFSHLKNEISQQNDYYRKQENRSYSQNEQIIKKLDQTNDKLEKQITQIDKLKKQENITGITIQPIHQIVQGFSEIKKEIDELKKWRKSQQTMSIGGYTGGSNVTKPQGIVHEGEYVVPQWMVNQNQQIIKQLESIRTQNKNYAVGGYVSNIQDQKTIQTLNQLKSQYGSKVAKMAQLPISKDANTINLQITILSQLLAKDTGGESFEITPQVQNILNYLSSEKIMQQLNPDTQPTVLDMVSKIPEFNKFTNSNNFSKTKKVNELKNEQKQLAGSIAKHKQFSELQKNIGFSNTDDFQYYLQLAFDQIQGMEDPQSSNLFINKFRKFNKILGLQFKPLTSIVESVNALAFKPTDYFGRETDNLVKSFFNLIRNKYTSLDDIRVPSFQTGGYTGQGNPREIQGLVHKDEFVLPSNTKSLWSIFTSTPVNLLKEILYYTKIDQIQSQSQLQIDKKLIAIEDKKYRDYLYDRNKQQKEKQLGSPEEIQLEQQKQQGISGTAGGFLTGLLGAKLQTTLGGIFGIQKGQGAFGNIKNVLSSTQGRVLGGVGGQIQIGADQYSQYNRSTQIDPITGQKTTDWGNVAQGTVQGSQEGGWLNQLGQQGKYQQLGTQFGGPLGTLVGGGVGLLLGGLGQERIKQFGEGQQELFTGIKVTEDQINEELQKLQKDPKYQNISEKELRKIQKTEAEQKKNPVVQTIRKGVEYMFNPFKMQGDILNNQFDIQETIDNKYAELKRDPKYKDMSDQQVMELQKKQYKEEHPILSFFSDIQTGISGFISNVWGNIVSIFTGTKNAQDTVNKDIENINNLMKDNNIDFSLPEVTSTTTTDNGLTINTIKGYSQGGFTDNVQPNIPVGVVHGGEYVVPQKLVPKYKPILTTIEKDRQSKLRGYEVGGIVDPPWLTNEPVTDLGNASQGLNELPTETPTQNDTTVKSTITLQGLNELPTETPAQNDTTVKSTITLDDLKKHSTGVIDPRILGALSFAESELNINQVGGNGYGPFQFEPSAYEQAINLGAITNLPHEEQAKNPQWAIKAADLTIQWLLRSKLPRLSEALIGWNRGRGNALNWIARGSKLEELPKATRGLLMRFINGLDKFLEEDSSSMNQESLSQVEDVLSVATNIINTYPEEAQLALGNISTGDLLSDLQVETPQQIDTTQELKDKTKTILQAEKDKLQKYNEFVNTFVETKLPNTKLTDLLQNLSKYKLFQDTSDIELINFDDLLSDLQIETPQQIDTTQQITKDVFSEELKDKIETNLQVEKDKLQKYNEFVNTFIKTKLPNTKLTDLLQNQENMKFLLGNMGIQQGTDIFDVNTTTLRNKILQNQLISPQFNKKQIPSSNTNIQQNLSKYRLFQDTSDIELINFDDLLSDLQIETPQQIDTTQELKDKTKTNLQVEKDKLQKYNEFVDTFIKTKLPNTKLIDLLQNQSKYKLFSDTSDIKLINFDDLLSNLQAEKNKLQKYNKFVDTFVETKLPNTKLTDLLQNLSERKLFQGTSDIELTNFDDLLSDLQTETPQQIDTTQQITKDVFSEELKDKTKTNLPLQDRENLNNSKIGILNYFIPKKDETMSDTFHFNLRKAQNESLLDMIKGSYGQYYDTNRIPPGFMEKMFVYDENGNNIIDDQDFVRAITLTPNSFAYNTVDDMGNRINNIVDTGRQFDAVWNRIFNNNQQLSQLLDPNLDIRYGETNFEGVPIFITEEKFETLRNSEIVGNMIPNNYPNSDFYSVFLDSKILSEPKLTDISDISNTHIGKEIQSLKSSTMNQESLSQVKDVLSVATNIINTYPEEAQLALGNISTGDLLSDLQVETPQQIDTTSDINNTRMITELYSLPVKTLPTTSVDDQYSKSFNTILKDKIEEIYNQYSNIYPRMYSNNKYTPEQQQIVEWYEDNLIGNNPSKYFSNKDWNKDLEQQQKNVIKSRKDQVKFERKVDKNDTIPYDKYLQGLTEKNIVDSLISKINKELLSQKDVISLLPVNPQHLEDKLTRDEQFNDKNKLFLLLQSYQDQLDNKYNSGLIKINDVKFQNSPQYQWWLQDLATNNSLDSQFDYLNGKVYSQLDEYIYSRFKNRIGEIGGDYDKVNILRDLSSKGIKEKLQYAFGVFWPNKRLKYNISLEDLSKLTIEDQADIIEAVENGDIKKEDLHLLNKDVFTEVEKHWGIKENFANNTYYKYLPLINESSVIDNLSNLDQYEELDNELMKLQWLTTYFGKQGDPDKLRNMGMLRGQLNNNSKYLTKYDRFLASSESLTFKDVYKEFQDEIAQEFKMGGYTGDGNFNEVQGIVHKGEYVVPKDIVDDNPILINELEKMRLRQEDVDNTTKYANQSFQDIQEIEELLDPLITSSDLIHNDNEKTVELLSKILEAILNNKPVEIPDELNVKGISELINMLKLNNKPQINNFIQPIARSNNFIQPIARSNNFIGQNNNNNNGNLQTIPLNVPLQ